MNLRDVLLEKFVYAEEVANILEIGFLTKKNIFLYGRGGHAKSEIINEFLKYIDKNGQETFVQACGEGMTEDKMFGGIDMKKFQRTGEIEYLVENSFMNKKYVVFEELLDSRMNVLLSLKDILTSGIFRQGKQQFKIRTELVICLTNRTKQEVSEDNSVKALLERFPLEMKIEWPKYEANDYDHMFAKVLKNNYPEIAQICHKINESGDFVSPRTAIHMAEVYKATNDLQNLKYFGLTEEIIDKIRKEKKEKQERDFLYKKEGDYKSLFTGRDSANTQSLKETYEQLGVIISDLDNRSYESSTYATYVELKDSIGAAMRQIICEISNIILNG